MNVSPGQRFDAEARRIPNFQHPDRCPPHGICVILADRKTGVMSIGYEMG